MLGELVEYSTKFNHDFPEEIMTLAQNKEDPLQFPVELGSTMCCDGFYEGNSDVEIFTLKNWSDWWILESVCPNPFLDFFLDKFLKVKEPMTGLNIDISVTWLKRENINKKGGRERSDKAQWDYQFDCHVL